MKCDIVHKVAAAVAVSSMSWIDMEEEQKLKEEE